MGMRLEPLIAPPLKMGREEVSRPARLTSLHPMAAVQRYMQVRTLLGLSAGAEMRCNCACCPTRQYSHGQPLCGVQDHKVAQLLHDVTGDVILAKPANPARFIRDWMSGRVGPEEADVQEASGGCFLRVHVECGLPGQRMRQHFSRKAPEKGFTAGVMRGWRREASEVLAGVVASVLGEGGGPEVIMSLDDQLRALQDRVREVEEELRGAREVAAELGARLAQAEADLNGGAAEDGRGEAAKGGWETTPELRGKLRELKEVFENMKTNGAVDADERAAASGLLNELHMAFGLRAQEI